MDDLDLDNCFDTEPGPYKLVWPDREVAIIPDRNFTKAIIYVPPGEDYFCVEPVTHAPNAINSPLPQLQTGLQWLEAGDCLQARIEMRIQARA